MRIALILLALFFLCAVPSLASAQTICERVLFQRTTCPPGSVRESADQFRARKMQGAVQQQVTTPQRGGYQRQGQPYHSFTDGICFGCNPYSNMGTLPGGGSFGNPGQWDHYNWGDYSSLTSLGSYWGGGVYYRDPDFAGGKYWVLKHSEGDTSCPEGTPHNTSAPRSYEWRCEQGVDAVWGAYVKKGRGHVLRNYAQQGIIDEHAVVKTRQVASSE